MKNTIGRIFIMGTLAFQSCDTARKKSNVESRMIHNNIINENTYIDNNIKLARETWYLMDELESMREDGPLGYAAVDPNEKTKRDDLIKSIISNLKSLKTSFQLIINNNNKNAYSDSNKKTNHAWAPENVEGDNYLIGLYEKNTKLPPVMRIYARSYRDYIRIMNAYQSKQIIDGNQVVYMIKFGEIVIDEINDTIEYYTYLEDRLIKLDAIKSSTGK